MNKSFSSWRDLIWDKLHRWATAGIKMLPNMAVAIIVAIAFFLLARLIKILVYKFVSKLSDNPALSGLFANIFSIIVTLIGLFVALEVLKLDKAVSSLLAGAGIIGLALGFAFQDLTANFISGIFITFRRPFEVGHQIETNGFCGNVEDIQLRSTLLRTIDGLHVIIPNKDIFQKPIINHSLTPERRTEITFNVPAVHESALEIQHLVTTALKDVDNLTNNKPPEVYFTNIDGANIKVTVACWVVNEDIRTFEDTKTQLIMKITAVLKNNKLI